MTQSNTEQTFHFRQEEIERVFSHVQAGESVSVIGVSGVGKSNFFNHLLDPNIQKHFLGKEENQYLLICINFHYLPDFSIRSVFSLFLDQLMLLEDKKEYHDIDEKIFEQIEHYHNLLINAENDLLKVQYYFTLALRKLLQNSQRRLVFLFDQFEGLFEAAESRLFRMLRGFREMYKYRLMYITFTRHDLFELAIYDDDREEFYELLSTNIIGLKPYNERDAVDMINRITKRNQFILPDKSSDKLVVLSGGHAGLLRAILFAVSSNYDILTNNIEELAQGLVENNNSIIECTKIWKSITVEEQKAIAALSHEADLQTVDASIQNLQLKGLLIGESKKEIFSLVFQIFIQNQEDVFEKSLFFDKLTRRVWIFGNPMQSLTMQEFRLFSCLYEHLDQAVGKDELINAVWPEAKGNVSDETLASAIYRLRKKIEPDPENLRFIHSEREYGYRLTSE